MMNNPSFSPPRISSCPFPFLFRKDVLLRFIHWEAYQTFPHFFFSVIQNVHLVLRQHPSSRSNRVSQSSETTKSAVVIQTVYSHLCEPTTDAPDLGYLYAHVSQNSFSPRANDPQRQAKIATACKWVIWFSSVFSMQLLKLLLVAIFAGETPFPGSL